MNSESDKFLKKAKESVVETSNALTVDDVYIVWFCKVLGSWKALISTDAFASHYWEVTYNGAKGETYVDTYVKTSNVSIKDKS